MLALIPELRDPSVALGAAGNSPKERGFNFSTRSHGCCARRPAAQPLVIVLDDLHAADTPSPLLLQFLAGQLGVAPVMLAGLYRDDDPSEDGALKACLASLARVQATRRIRLTV